VTIGKAKFTRQELMFREFESKAHETKLPMDKAHLANWIQFKQLTRSLLQLDS
jgi:hypothetical protein